MKKSLWDKYQIWHLPHAKGRVENNLPPAPLKQKWSWNNRVFGAVSVLAGNSIAVRCHYHEPPANVKGRNNES